MIGPIHSYFIPIVAMAKPLAYDLNISVNNCSNSFVLSRTEEAKALAPVLLENIQWLKQSLKVKKEEVAANFVAAMISSNGTVSEKCEFGERSIELFIRNSVFGYVDGSTDSILASELSKRVGKAYQSSKEIIHLLTSCRRSISRFWRRLRCVDPALEIEKTVLIERLLMNCAKMASTGKASVLLNPIYAVKDYFYVCGDSTVETLITFLRLCSAYSIDLKKHLGMIAQAVFLMEAKLGKSRELPTNEFLGELVSHYEQMNLLRYLTDKCFYLFISLPVEERRLMVKCEVVDKNDFHVLGKSYAVNLRAAQSVHFQITSQDVGYTVGLRKQPWLKRHNDHSVRRDDARKVFGKIVETGKIIHGNTRKNSLYKPFSSSQQGIIENLNVENHLFFVRTKYRLSGSVHLYLFSLLLMSLFGLYTVVNGVKIDYSQIDGTNLLKTTLKTIISNRIVKQDFSGTEQALVFLLAFVPLVGTLISTFMLTNWSIVHHLIRWYKRLIILSSFTAIYITVAVHLGIPLFAFGPVLFILQWILLLLECLLTHCLQFIELLL